MTIDDDKNDRFEKRYPRGKVRIEIYGEELIEKTVTSCGINGRIYLPQTWIGKKVKIVKC